MCPNSSQVCDFYSLRLQEKLQSFSCDKRGLIRRFLRSIDLLGLTVVSTILEYLKTEVRNFSKTNITYGGRKKKKKLKKKIKNKKKIV